MLLNMALFHPFFMANRHIYIPHIFFIHSSNDGHLGQSNLEKEKESWRNQAPGLQTILQSYSNQDDMVLAQKTEI